VRAGQVPRELPARTSSSKGSTLHCDRRSYECRQSSVGNPCRHEACCLHPSKPAAGLPCYFRPRQGLRSSFGHVTGAPNALAANAEARRCQSAAIPSAGPVSTRARVRPPSDPAETEQPPCSQAPNGAPKKAPPKKRWGKKGFPRKTGRSPSSPDSPPFYCRLNRNGEPGEHAAAFLLRRGEG